MKKNKIFIIEDNVMILAALKAQFSVIGFEVRVNLGDCGIHDIKDSIIKFKPDFIILDLILPQVSGFDILKMIKHDEHIYGHLSTPVFVFSDLSDEDIKRRCEIIGADYFFMKNDFNIEEFVSKVKKIIKNKHT